MAIRKIIIPYTNFLPNTTISAEHFNTNFDEIEYVFNQLYDDYLAYKDNTYTKEEVDEHVSKEDLKLQKIIEDNKLDNELTTQNAYNAFIALLDSDISDISMSGSLNPTSTGYITDEQIQAIVGGVFVG